MGMLQATSLETFDTDVLQRSTEVPVLVDFWAEWCGPCLVIAPVLEQLARLYQGQLEVLKLEVDDGENMKLAGQYAVRGFPTVILFQNGEETERFMSARTLTFIEQFLDEHLQEPLQEAI